MPLGSTARTGRIPRQTGQRHFGMINAASTSSNDLAAADTPRWIARRNAAAIAIIEMAGDSTQSILHLRQVQSIVRERCRRRSSGIVRRLSRRSLVRVCDLNNRCCSYCKLSQVVAINHRMNSPDPERDRHKSRFQRRNLMIRPTPMTL